MENKSTDRRIIAGILLMLAGALLLLDTFNMSDIAFSHYIFSWKTLLIGLGLIFVFSKERQVLGGVLIGLGVVFWIPSLVDYNIRFGQVFLPALLMGIGILILTRRNGHRHHHGASRSSTGTASEYVDDVSILGGGVKQVQSKNFKGGNITAIFGGSEINLREAQISPEGCTLDVFTMFGGSKLIVPDSWEIKSEVISIFGGFTDKRPVRPLDPDSPNTILIKGVVIFGGFELKAY